MKMDVVAGSQFDEYYTPLYVIPPIMKHLRPNSTIWCPFDTDQSNFVKILKQNNFKVINTHISNGDDFFTTDIECDYIISNPPYSLKNKVFERLFDLGKPFAMLVGVVGIFESKTRFEMFKQNNFEIMYFNKRISYFKNFDDQKPSVNPPFSSVYICRNILPNQIIFEDINK